MDNLLLPYISVIIPTRNRSGLLARALYAIKLQSFPNFEVIVVDDGSLEDTKSQYQQLWSTLDSRFILHSIGQSTIKGIGPSAARNIGLSIARGDVIAFCDDDDFWTAADHLEAMSAVFLAQPQVDMYIANQTGNSKRGIEIANWFPKLTSRISQQSELVEPNSLVSVHQLCVAGGFAHLNVLSLRKRIVNQAGGFWERVSYEEDRDFFWRALDRCNEIYFNPRIIAQHNIPDPGKEDNQSTQHALVERWLLAILVCQHIASGVRNPLIARSARRYEGDLLRRLAKHFNNIGRHAQGLAFACRALGARFSFKWSMYLALLAFKSLFIKEAR